MKPRLHNLRREAALLLACIALFSACAKLPTSGVSVKPFEANFVFGVPPLPEPGPGIAPEPGFDDDFGLLGVGPTRRPTPTRTPAPRVPCPKGDLSKAAAITANIDPPNPPAAGKYRWKVVGYELTPDNTRSPERITPLGSFLDREVRKVEKLTSGDFDYTYSIIGKDPNTSARREYTIKVDLPDAQGRGNSAEHVPGIYLTQISVNPDSNNPSAFILQPPINLLPLPARGGSIIRGTAVNGGGFEVLQVEGTVQEKKKRVDACGDVFDSWYVDSVFKFTAQQGDPTNPSDPNAAKVGTINIDFDYAFATSMGGLLSFIHMESPPCPDDPEKRTGGGTDEEAGGEQREVDDDPQLGFRKCKTTGDYYEFELGMGQIVPSPVPASPTPN